MGLISSFALAGQQPASNPGVGNSSATASPADLALRKIMEDDDAAADEVDLWINEANARKVEGDTIGDITLNARIRQRFEKVGTAYQDYLRRYPHRVEARLAYGSFLYDLGEEADAVVQWERCRDMDPKNPVPWNNLANHFAHRGPVMKSYEYFEKAIELKPDESVYYHNLADMVYLYRMDSQRYYKCDVQGVFTQALNYYNKALELDPQNFPLATDIAMTYYGIKPARVEQQLAAYQKAFVLARDDIEQQGIHVHFARIKMNAGLLKEAAGHLKKVIHPMYEVLKARLNKKLQQLEADLEVREGANLG